MKPLPDEQTLLEWLALTKEAEQKAKELCDLTAEIDEKWRIRLESKQIVMIEPKKKIIHLTMDTLEKYREIVEKVLSDYAAVPYAHGEFKTEIIFDRTHDHYLLINVGWNNKRRVHGCIIHIDIIEGKLWIQRDGTEQGIALDLEEAGIPKEHIVLGFREPEIRKYTGYAIAKKLNQKFNQ